MADPTNQNQPLDSDAVKGAAAELRALKGYLQTQLAAIAASFTATNGNIVNLQNAATADEANITLLLGIFSKSFTSAQQTVDDDSTLTLAHGLGAVPKIVHAVYKCITAELGYAVGDEVTIVNTYSGATGQKTGAEIEADATNINVIQLTGFRLMRKDTQVDTLATPAKWKIIVRAFA